MHWSSGSEPAGTEAQVPTDPVSAHDAQLPAQAVAQQTFCAQLLWRHWLAVVHAWPSGSLPQLVPTQLFGDTQSAVLPQVILQAGAVGGAAGSQMYGSQSEVVTDLHTPAPSHRRGGVSVEPTQLGVAHWVVLAQNRQAPAPLHMPSVPQVVETVVAHCEGGFGAVPLATLLQVPSLPEVAHDLQVPVQAWSQQ